MSNEKKLNPFFAEPSAKMEHMDQLMEKFSPERLSEAAQEREAREEAEKERYQQRIADLKQRIADLEQRTAARKNGNS
jgi:predicted ribosome quality control (RQC) complex YloA/Tae2 family protein